MKIGIPRETAAGERRVALVPDVVSRLVGRGFEIVVERGAGESATFSDDAYRAAGAGVVSAPREVWSQADVILKVQAPAADEAALAREGTALVAMFQPQPELLHRLAQRRLTAFTLVRLPRITRAQPMDVLSSQATLAGYKAVLLAAVAAGRVFPMLVTAAGTLPPARVLVLGAGVAGLQAIATARRLGGVVSAFDVRPAVKEQVESLGATFLAMELAEETETAGGYAKALSEEAHRRELEFIGRHVREADVVITTAQIPGRPAPRLITEEAVRGMRPGSVIVDLAAETGGNCELTSPGAEVVRHGVAVLGPVNLASTVPAHASQMYARNVAAFLQHLAPDGRLRLDFSDEIIRETCVTHEGKVLHP
ncbi:MAG TPA: Re/Si-specific NAD(P)(+) transhydrogenase subunit alpha [Gemmatimonadales bacterium]|nr:Re/Si-specific NAD(P)(+) transhydrogenase subunit alpha [Gemmatimonadales bacterium]